MRDEAGSIFGNGKHGRRAGAGGLPVGGGAEEVILSNRTRSKAQALADETGCSVAADNRTAAGNARYLFLGVKPHLVRQLLEEVSPVLTRGQVLVSMAAGLTTEALASWAPAGVPILRIMPNTPSAIGKGMTALCAAPGVGEEHLAAVEAILTGSGRVERLEERLMDAFSAVAGCGPAFVYPFLEAMADGGVLAGLPREQAKVFAAQTMLGAAALVLESGEHPGALKDAVSRPAAPRLKAWRRWSGTASAVRCWTRWRPPGRKTPPWARHDGRQNGPDQSQKGGPARFVRKKEMSLYRKGTDS